MNSDIILHDGKLYMPARFDGPNAGFRAGGIFGVAKNDEPFELCHNLVPNAALDDLLNVYLCGGTPKTAWYIAPFTSNVTPASTWTAANFDSIAGELTDYDEATRQVWTPGSIADQAVSNIADEAAFTINASVTVYGAGFLSASAKEATTGILFSAFRFPTARDFEENDIMRIAYFVQAQSA